MSAACFAVAMVLALVALFSAMPANSDVFDWVCERVFEGHEGRFVVVMVLLFAAVGGME